MTIKIFLHALKPGHGLYRNIDNDMKRWYSDGIGRVYGCTCGKKWYR